MTPLAPTQHIPRRRFVVLPAPLRAHPIVSGACIEGIRPVPLPGVHNGKVDVRLLTTPPGHEHSSSIATQEVFVWQS